MRMGRPRIGDRATSDVVVRLRTREGRDEWFYCHSEILTAKSKYFADRLSNDWPTCQILDSRHCVEVYCQEPDFSSHVNVLRLLYADEPCSRYGVRSTLGILQAAIHLGCPQMVAACVDYLESAPWDEADEDEILNTIPRLGSQYEHVLARLRPMNPVAITDIFISAFRCATLSSAAGSVCEPKASAQEQLEYMLTDDDDAPLPVFDSEIVKSEVMSCVMGLLARFSDFTDSILTKCQEMTSGADLEQELHSFVSDIAWLCQILSKLEMMKGLVHYWVGSSFDIVQVVELVCVQFDCLKTRLKLIEASAKVLEAIAFGNIVLPTERRRHVVSIWIGFAQRTKPLVEQANHHNDDDVTPKFIVDNDVWQNLESVVVSIVLTLPSSWQAEILSEWLQSKHARFPDLSEVFEVWCYRSKVARKRLSFLSYTNRD